MILSEIIKLNYGKAQHEVQVESSNIPIYGTSGIIGFSKIPIYHKPSILFGRKGSIAKIQFVDKPFWCVDTAFYSEIDEQKVIPKYLYYKLSTINFLAYDEGTTIPSLRIETLDNIEIDLDDIQTQQHIVDTIGTVDDLIEKKEEKYKSLLSYGMEFYKDKIKDDYTEKNIVEFPIKYGKSIVSKNRIGGHFPLYASNGRIDFIDSFNAESAVIFGCRGTIGNVFFSKDKCFVLNTAFFISSTNDYGNLFFSIKNESGMKLFASGAAQPQITLDNLKQAKLKFIMSDFLNLIIDLADKYLKVIDCLKTIKQLLLEKYFG